MPPKQKKVNNDEDKQATINSFESKSSAIITSENINSIFTTLSVLVIVIVILVVYAPNGHLIKDLLVEIFNIIFIKGIGGAFNSIKLSLESASIKIYNDIPVDRLVLYVAVAVIVRQFPWVMDSIVLMLSKPPK